MFSRSTLDGGTKGFSLGSNQQSAAPGKGTRIVQADSGSDSDSESRNLNLLALYAYPNPLQRNATIYL